MRRLECVVTALSSISHGQGVAGTVQEFRREKIVQPDGTVAEVPVVSGNGVRGVLRDISARITHRLLGEPDLPLAVFDVLWSGGALMKAGSGSVLGSRQLRDLRALVPHVDLFGAAGGGRIIEGRLAVGKLVPLVAETAHVTPDAGPRPSMWDVMQVEEFSRQDDAKRPQLSGIIAGALPTAGEQGSLLGDVDPTPDLVRGDGPAQQMRYGAETIAAGTRFAWWLRLDPWTTPLVEAQLRAALNEWVSTGAHVGGRSATGHGRLAFELTGWARSDPQLTGGDGELAPAWHDQLTAHYRDHAADALDALSWLG